jgi:ABC-type dipeptide/oligopeptide/nickel transport system permease subunit
MVTKTASSQPAVVRLASGREQEVGLSLTQLALRRIRRNPVALVAMGVLVALVILSLLAHVISDQILHVDPNLTDTSQQLLPVGTPGHPLGTDNVGRDQLARLLFAGQVSLGIASAAAVLSLGVGMTLGVIAGYYGGIVDDLVVWIVTTLNSIPGIFLLLIVSSLFQPGPTTLILVLGIFSWTLTTRLVRGETFAIREQDYVLSARALGASDWRIMFAHIIPNVISIMIVNLTITVGNLILIESALSFLGIGIQPPTPSWGNMLSRAQSFFSTGPHLVVFPGLLIVITVLCLYIIGDGLRDAFDPNAVD